MGDPLSTAASIVAVIQISGTVLSACYRYAALIENAPQDIQWVINEVGSLKVILEELKALALSASDKQPGPSQKSLKRLRDDNDKAQQSTQPSRKPRKVQLSISDALQENHPTSLQKVDDQIPLVTCLENSRIDLTPPGSSNSALFKSLNAAHGPLKTCEAALRAISDKLGTVAEASRAKKMLVWPFKADAVQKILRVIQKQKSNLILALASDEARAVSQMEDSLETNAEALLQIKHVLAQNMEILTEVRDVVQIEIERKELEKMKQWLQSTDPGPNHRAAQEAHEPFTGNWLLESADYCAWRASSGDLLWLNGISGCGKTVLSATVIEDVRLFCSTDPENCYAYYYFDFNDAAKRKPHSMVSSLLGMLGCNTESPPQCIRDLHDKHLSGQREPSLDDMFSALVSILQGRRKVYILLDALDECLEQDRLLKCICTIESTCKNVSIFVSSRREFNITQALVERVTYDIDMKTAAVDADIELFVQNFLSTDKALGKWPSDIRAEIKDELCRRSCGMFRWAACQLESLRKCRTLRSLRETLQDLPNGLYETYDRILSNVSEVHQVHVQRALILLAFSLTPMSLGEVAEAVLVGRERQSTDPGDEFRDVHDLLDLCSSFVCLEGKHPRWYSVLSFCERSQREKAASDAYLVLRLAHSSVKEYILSDRTNITSLGMDRLTSGIAQRLMAEVCLIYLNQFNDESSFSDKTLQRHQFLFYATDQWYIHYNNMPAEEENNVVDLLLSFINTHYNGYAYRNWIQLFDRYSNPYQSVDRQLRSLQPLVALSFLGPHRAVRAIVENVTEAHMTEDLIGESLNCASSGSHEAVVRVLPNAGVKLNRAGVMDTSLLRQALDAATTRGRIEVIELLISKGGTLERLDYSFVPRIAGRHGKVDRVKLFLDCTTTNRNKIEAFYGALQAATTARQSSILRSLMERSAEIEITAREDLYFPTLLRAFFERYDSTVQLLINRAFGSKAMDIRRAKLEVLDTSYTPRTKLLILQILGAGIDHPLLERNHERDYIPPEDAYWVNAVEIEDTIKETLLEERKLLEEEELIEETTALLQRIRSLSTVLSPAVETRNDGIL